MKTNNGREHYASVEIGLVVGPRLGTAGWRESDCVMS